MMTSSAVFFIFLLLTLLLTASSDLKKEAAALIYFINNVKIPPHKSDYNWTKLQNSKIKVCDWKGIVCSPHNDSVIHLSLPAASLVGEIPQNCFGNLTSLTRLSLHTNRLFGSIPEDFANLRSLKYVYLHKNNFSGPFPSVTKWTNLKHLYLSDNNFHGRLPNNVPSSIEPKNFSVSNNNFIGPIPESLSNKFDRKAFSGNIYLCGNLSLCNNKSIPWQSQSPSGLPSLSNNKKNKLCTAAIVAIAVGSALILLILFLYLRKKRSRAVKEKNAPGVATMARRGFGGGGEAGTSSSKDDVTGAFIEGDRSKLVFFEGGVYNFNLDDLLRASVEVLGKGSVGMWYKAVLHEGTTVVVKRLKDVVVSKKEFDGVMEGLGKMKNENVVPIRAYYYSKDEKLLVSDYFPAGSLSALLHGRRGSGCTPLDWDHRFRIALSAAKGVAYLHVTGKVVHGNIKPSNILLRQDSNKDACVSDFGLNTLFGGSQNTRVTGYRAPEVLETREVTFNSDVYSFGVLLLELLSGKAPNHASLHEKGTDLPSWVKSVKGEEWTVQEDWTTEVFDAQLMMYPNIKEKMVQLLQIAMTCVSTMPDQRPTMQDVVCKMEDMNWAEIDDGMRQSSDDPSKGSDGHTHPMESRNSPSTITP